MTTEEKITMLEALMDLDEGTLSIDDRLEDYEEWDSLSKLSLIVEAKREFHLILKAETLRQFVTVKDVCDYLQ